MAGHGTFHWNELMTGDVEKAKTFFSQTIGWSFNEMPMPEGTYWVAMLGDKPVGGIMSMQGIVPEGTPPHWISHLAVDDIDARLAKVVSAGGEIKREPFDVPNVGRIAIVQDASGAVMGWITPAQQD